MRHIVWWLLFCTSTAAAGQPDQAQGSAPAAPATTSGASTAPTADALTPLFWLNRASSAVSAAPADRRAVGYASVANAQWQAGDDGGLRESLDAVELSNWAALPEAPLIARHLAAPFAVTGNDRQLDMAIEVLLTPIPTAAATAPGVAAGRNAPPRVRGRWQPTRVNYPQTRAAALALAQVGRADEALRLAEAEDEPEWRFRLLCQLVVQSGLAGRASQAAALADAAERSVPATTLPDIADQYHLQLSEACVSAGDLPRALRTSQSASDPVRAAILARVAAAHVEAGRNAEGARAAAEAVKLARQAAWSSATPDAVAVTLASSIVATGDVAALAGIRAMAAAAAKAGPRRVRQDGEQAAAADGGATFGARPKVLAAALYEGLAIGHARRGDVRAADAAVRAWQDTQRANERESRVEAGKFSRSAAFDFYPRLVSVHLAAGNTDAALRVAEAIPSDHPRSQSASGARIDAYTASGRLTEATQLATMPSDHPEDRVVRLCRAAGRYGTADDALRRWIDTRPPEQRIEANRAVALGLVHRARRASDPRTKPVLP